jgi:hypothetical protein
MFWRKRSRRRGSIRRTRLNWQVLFGVVALLICNELSAADKVSELQDRFDREAHATKKVKMLDKLSEAQFEAATRAGKDGDYSSVALIFEKYRDNVQTAFELLKKQDPDADRHPNGYRQIELQVRRGLREAEETLIIVPEVVRPPMQIVRKDLLDIDNALMASLFPRRTKDPQRVPSPPASRL